MIAKQLEYKADKLRESITLKIGAFELEIPDEPMRKIVASDGDVIIYYSDGQRLLVGENKGPDVGGVEGLAVNQFPRIVFMKTDKDVKPSIQNDRFFWDVALYQKPAVFDQASLVGFAVNDDIEYFISDSQVLGFSGSAMISAQNIKDVFLQVRSMNMDFTKFRKIVYSAQTGK